MITLGVVVREVHRRRHEHSMIGLQESETGG